MAVADVSSASSGATGSVSTLSPPARRLSALTTPGWFRLAAVVLVAGLVALAVVSVRVVLNRSDATNAVVDEATPLLVSAEDLYVALADADAAASTAFLSAGLEPPDLRIRYLADLETAGAELAHLAARSRGSTGSSEAVAVINQELLVYAGQVEAARTNNRQDFPVGAAYLRASDEMRNSILPTASGSTRPPHAGCTTTTSGDARVTGWSSSWRAASCSHCSWPRRCSSPSELGVS